MTLIEEMRAKFRAGAFEYSQHAVGQSILRHISVSELCEAVEGGEVIEDYPNDKYGPSCLILGFTVAGRPVHVQCSYPSRPLIKVITIYEPEPTQWIDSSIGEIDMAADWPEEKFVDQRVTYVLETDGGLIVVENVPARVSVRTGERLFAPETVERLQQIAWEQKQPARVVETPIFEFSDSPA